MRSTSRISSTASVVFLYMGDHFNMLIRPILWRDLKVGARVVSHRFLMGDWKPDKTVTIPSEQAANTSCTCGRSPRT